MRQLIVLLACAIGLFALAVPAKADHVPSVSFYTHPTTGQRMLLRFTDGTTIKQVDSPTLKFNGQPMTAEAFEAIASKRTDLSYSDTLGFVVAVGSIGGAGKTCDCCKPSCTCEPGNKNADCVCYPCRCNPPQQQAAPVVQPLYYWYYPQYQSGGCPNGNCRIPPTIIK